MKLANISLLLRPRSLSLTRCDTYCDLTRKMLSDGFKILADILPKGERVLIFSVSSFTFSNEIPGIELSFLAMDQVSEQFR